MVQHHDADLRTDDSLELADKLALVTAARLRGIADDAAHAADTQSVELGDVAIQDVDPWLVKRATAIVAFTSNT